MKIHKLIYLEPLKGKGSRRLEVDCAELSVEDYAMLRGILDNLGLIDGHPHASEVAGKSGAITIAIEMDSETKITCLPSEADSDDAAELLTFIRENHTVKLIDTTRVQHGTK